MLISFLYCDNIKMIPQIMYLFLKLYIKLSDVSSKVWKSFHHLNQLVIILMESKSNINSIFIYHKNL